MTARNADAAGEGWCWRCLSPLKPGEHSETFLTTTGEYRSECFACVEDLRCGKGEDVKARMLQSLLRPPFTGPVSASPPLGRKAIAAKKLQAQRAQAHPSRPRWSAMPKADYLAAVEQARLFLKAVREGFGFRPGYPFRKRIAEAVSHYNAVAGRQRVTAREKRAKLIQIEKEARACLAGKGSPRLHDSLARRLLTNPGDLPQAPARIEHLFGVGPDGLEALIPEVPLQFTRSELKKILKAVAKTRPYLLRRRPPIRGDGDLRILLRALADIWESGTGRRATITNFSVHTRRVPRRPEDVRGGRYLRFLRLVVRRVKPDVTSQALARLHARVTKN